MKRLIYFSRYAGSLLPGEVQELGRRAAERNRPNGVTGVLLCLRGTFFQVLEGEGAVLDEIYGAICRDPRHTDVMVISVEEEAGERLFPNWSMQTIDLDGHTEPLLQPLKIILGRLAHVHRIIERYTQPDLLRILAGGGDPLSLPARRVRRIILFADIVGFSSLAEKAPCEAVVDLLNRFFEVATAAVVARGGEVSKLIGDCILASFPAEDPDEAIQAAMDLLVGLADLRRAQPSSPEEWFPHLHCGIGLDMGEVIEGNIGSSQKLDFTLVGDVVNAAQRLESLTRMVGKALVVSGSVRQACRRPWPWLPLGSRTLKGKEATVEPFSIDHPLRFFPGPKSFGRGYGNPLTRQRHPEQRQACCCSLVRSLCRRSSGNLLQLFRSHGQ